MWGTIVSALGGLAKSWLDGRKAKWEAEAKFQMRLAEIEATWDLIALRQAQYSWKDELITIIIFWPLIAWWIPPLREQAFMWVEFVEGMPTWYQITMFGIISASFGLRWWFKQTGMNFSATGETTPVKRKKKAPAKEGSNDYPDMTG